MNSVLFASELLGSRPFLHSTSGRNRSRVLKPCLERAFGGSRKAFSHPPAFALQTGREYAFLRTGELPGPDDPSSAASKESIESVRKAIAAETSNNHVASGRWQSELAGNRDCVSPAALSGVQTRYILQALQEGDTRKLYLGLSRAGEQQDAAIASLPPTAFSEFLRCLDPFVTGKELDYARGVPIHPGLGQFTQLGQLVNNYGVRLLYVSLLKRVLAICELRRNLERRILVADYWILMRCAGAASDMSAAKGLWQYMHETNGDLWRQSEAYAEFVRARFLTESLYAQYDHPRFRVRPINLHMQKIWIPGHRLRRLDTLRRQIEAAQPHRFGQNMNRPEYAESLTRILRKTKPIRKILAKTASLGLAREENFLCAVMIALGRTGSNRAVSAILNKYWGIQVAVDKGTGEVHVDGGASFAPDAPMRPTARLMDAVVQSYCCNGEVSTALQLVSFISRRYGIRIPDQVWFDLLSWTYVMVSRPVSLEWKFANFPGKMLKPHAVQEMWDVMTSEPYNVGPGFAQYNILIKTLISQYKYAEAMDRMQQLKSTYDAQLREYEDATLEYSQTVAQDVSRGPALKRFKRAAVTKWYMWYCYQVWCWKILKKVRPRRIDDDFIVRTLPKLVDTFRPFMPMNIKYRTATGFVHIQEPLPHPRHRTVHRELGVPELRPRVIGGGRVLQSTTTEGPTDVQDLALQHRRLVRRLRRRILRVRQPLTEAPDLRVLDSNTPRDFLLREFT